MPVSRGYCCVVIDGDRRGTHSLSGALEFDTGNNTRPRLAKSFELFEPRLGVSEIRSVEALGEPVVDLGEHSASLVATIGLAQQPGETSRRAQLPALYDR
jgi:hypothetical protein